MKKIAIYGAGGFGREVKMLIDQINEKDPQWDIIGFYDDSFTIGQNINNVPIIGGIKELNLQSSQLALVLAIGRPLTKQKILQQIECSGIYFPTLVHPSAIIGKDEVSIGSGTIVCAGNIITTNIQIGSHVILNLYCTVGHDTTIGSYCSFMPSVNISGEVNIKESVYVGTGAKIINQLEIGANTMIGAGAVVAKSLPSNCTAVGIPAKPIKFHND